MKGEYAKLCKTGSAPGKQRLKNQLINAAVPKSATWKSELKVQKSVMSQINYYRGRQNRQRIERNWSDRNRDEKGVWRSTDEEERDRKRS